MSSFVNANLGSDSESDDSDYDPTKDGAVAEAISEEEDSGDNEDDTSGKRKSKKTTKKKKSKPDVALGRRRGGILSDGDLGLNDPEEENRRKEFEAEKLEKKDEQEKKKIEDLWADFKKDVKPTNVPNPTVKSPSTSTSKLVGSGLGAWGSKAKGKPQPKKVLVVKKPISDPFATFEKKKDEGQEETKEEISTPIASVFSSIFQSISSSTAASSEEPSSIEEASEDVVTIKKVFDFAGEAVEVTKQVSRDSKEAQKFLKEEEEKEKSGGAVKRPASSSTAGSGLSSIVGLISGKKQKMGTLDKSKLDWNEFVQKEGIKEELQTFNKGKEGYVEKQLFLERADLRRFEIEKEAREKARKTLNR